MKHYRYVCNISPVSLFDAPNKNLITSSPRFLLSKAKEVSPSNKPTSSSTTSSNVDDVESLTVKREVVCLDAFFTNMRGETKKHVEALVAQPGASQELLEEEERLEWETSR
jgi:type II secretory pathway component GspD/PulD (secretin)